MSVVFVVAPAVVAGWPILCGAIAGAAGILGYKALGVSKCIQAEESAGSFVEVSLENSEVIADAMKREGEFVVAKDDVTATFRRAADGRCTVHVTGKNKTQEELSAIGTELVGRVTQQYAYNQVVTEMKKQGFNIVNEEVGTDQTIRISVCKYV